jgi:hypothetical protein
VNSQNSAVCSTFKVNAGGLAGYTLAATVACILPPITCATPVNNVVNSSMNEQSIINKGINENEPQLIVIPVFIQKGTKYTESQIINAFSIADFCGYINPTVDYTLNFDDGTIVQLYSEKTRLLKSIPTDKTCVRSEDVFEDTSVWSINSGVLIRNIKSGSLVKTISTNKL